MYYLFYYYVPKDHLNTVNTALFKLGLGKIGDYDSCCWVTKGLGQFRPLADSNPFIGSKNTIEHVEEYKVEMVCPMELKSAVIVTLKLSHPYEEPAYGFIKVDL